MAGDTLLYSGTSWGEQEAQDAPSQVRFISAASITTTGIAKQDSLTLSGLVESQTGYRLVTDGGNRNFSDVLRRLQQHTQLDWGQIARTLGVSRRTVHNWLSGTRVSGVNASRLAAFYNAALKELSGVDRKDAREHLLAPQDDGSSALARITRYLRENYKDSGLPVRASELLRPASTPEQPSITGGFDEAAEIPDLDDHGLPVSP